MQIKTKTKTREVSPITEAVVSQLRGSVHVYFLIVFGPYTKGHVVTIESY